MDLTISLEGGEVDPGDVDLLEQWLEESDLIDVAIGSEQAPPGEGEMDGGIVLLTAILAAPAVVKAAEALVKSIHEWIRTRVKTTTVKIRRPDGTEIEISTSSVDAEDHRSLQAKAELLAAST